MVDYVPEKQRPAHIALFWENLLRKYPDTHKLAKLLNEGLIKLPDNNANPKGLLT